MTVRYRRGGETLKPCGDRHTRQLRDLFQQAGIPTWDRPRMPLIEADGHLIGVGDKWLEHRGSGRPVRVRGPEVLVQRRDLAVDLGVRDVLGRSAVQDVYDDRYFGAPGA